eukprot:EG_transcript_4735
MATPTRHPTGAFPEAGAPRGGSHAEEDGSLPGVEVTRRAASHHVVETSRTSEPLGLLGALRYSKSQDFYIRTTTVVANVSFEGFPFEVDRVSKDFVFVPNQVVDVNALVGPHQPTLRALAHHYAGLLAEDLLCLGGVLAIVGLEYGLRLGLAALGSTFPAAVTGLFLLFGFLCLVDHYWPAGANAIVHYFTPAVVFLSRWLGLLFVPSLVGIPTIADRIQLEEVPLAMTIIALKTAVLILVGAGVSTLVAKAVARCQPAPAEEAKPLQPRASPLPPPLPTGGSLLRLLAVVVFGLAALPLCADPAVDEAVMFAIWLAALFFAFSLALHVQRWAGRRVAVLGQLLQPVMTSTALLLALLHLVAALKQQTLLQALAQFSKGKGVVPPAAGDVVSALLAPAVVSMAFGMFRSRRIVFQNFVLIAAMTFIIAVLGIVLLALACRVFSISPTLAISLVPTTASTPFAMESTRMLGGGDAKLSATGSIFAGVVGTLVGRLLLNAVDVRAPLLRGIAIGGASHGVATGMLVMDEPASAPFSATSFAFVGSITATLTAFEPVRRLILMLLGYYIEIPFGE